MKDHMAGDSKADGGLRDGQKYGQRLAIHVLEELAASEPEHLVGKMVKPSSRCALLEFLDLRASQLRDAVNHASHLIDEVTGKGNGSTIAFIGLQDFRYWAMELAAMKTALFYSGAGTPLEAAAKAIHHQSIPSILVYLIPSLEEMTAHTVPHYPYTKTYEEGKDDVILIPHTFGSTANPKPIYYTNLFLNRVDADRLVSQVEGRKLANLTLGQPGDLALAAFPFFHLSGIGTMGLMLFYRLTIVIGPNIEVLSGKIACEIAKTLNLRIMLMLPFMCDALVEYEDEIKPALVDLKYMIWLGGPLARKTGEWVTKHLPHVNLWQFYGSTETYMIPMLVPPKNHWHAFEFHPALSATFEKASEDSNLLELVIQRQDIVPEEMLPPVFSLFPNHQEWRTRDLFRRYTDSGCENLMNYEVGKGKRGSKGNN